MQLLWLKNVSLLLKLTVRSKKWKYRFYLYHNNLCKYVSHSLAFKKRAYVFIIVIKFNQQIVYKKLKSKKIVQLKYNEQVICQIRTIFYRIPCHNLSKCHRQTLPDSHPLIKFMRFIIISYIPSYLWLLSLVVSLLHLFISIFHSVLFYICDWLLFCWKIFKPVWNL